MRFLSSSDRENAVFLLFSELKYAIENSRKAFLQAQKTDFFLQWLPYVVISCLIVLRTAREHIEEK